MYVFLYQSGHSITTYVLKKHLELFTKLKEMHTQFPVHLTMVYQHIVVASALYTCTPSVCNVYMYIDLQIGN